MPNNFLTPQIIANEALMVLQANLLWPIWSIKIIQKNL